MTPSPSSLWSTDGNFQDTTVCTPQAQRCLAGMAAAPVPGAAAHTCQEPSQTWKVTSYNTLTFPPRSKGVSKYLVQFDI